MSDTGSISLPCANSFGSPSFSKSLIYYAERLKPPKATQIVGKLRRPFDKGKVKVTDPISYFRSIYSTF